MQTANFFDRHVTSTETNKYEQMNSIAMVTAVMAVQIIRISIEESSYFERLFQVCGTYRYNFR